MSGSSLSRIGRRLIMICGGEEGAVREMKDRKQMILWWRTEGKCKRCGHPHKAGHQCLCCDCDEAGEPNPSHAVVEKIAKIKPEADDLPEAS